MNLRSMTDVEKRAAAKAFVETWTGRGDEKQDAQNYWRDLLHDIFGVVQPSAKAEFEYPVKKEAGKNNIFIDAYHRLERKRVHRPIRYRHLPCYSGRG